jgi:hypothetical protein
MLHEGRSLLSRRWVRCFAMPSLIARAPTTSCTYSVENTTTTSVFSVPDYEAIWAHRLGLQRRFAQGPEGGDDG